MLRVVAGIGVLFLSFLENQIVNSAEGVATNFQVKSIDGETIDLSSTYQGKVLLVVNVASKCGLTPQYTGLQKLYDKYKDQGLVILGFPCNEFNGQEPGSEAEIKQFCSTKYNVTFPLFSKIKVNGPEAEPLYKHLTSQVTKPQESGKISWNFEKFLIGKDGTVVARFSPRTTPDAQELIQAVEQALK
jgi:glutathione peroxidase